VLATETLAELAGRRAERERWAAELDAARRAVPVAAAEEALAAAERRVERARQAEGTAARALADVDGAVGDESAGEDGVGTLQERVAAVREQAGGLARLVDEAAQQERDVARVSDIQRKRERAERLAGELAERTAALPDQVADAREQRETAVRAAERLAGLRARAAELDGLRRAMELLLPDKERAAADARSRLSRATDRHQAARETLLDVRQRRLAGMAAELAGKLVPGADCPVCGAAEHPRPAERVDEAVSETDEQAAEQAERAAGTERDNQTRAAHEADAAVGALREQLGERTPAGLAADLTEARGQLAEATELAETVPARTGRVRELETEAESARARQAELDRERATLGADRDALAELVRDRAERLAQARGGFPDVAARRAHLIALADALGELVSARGAVRDAENVHGESVAAVGVAAEKAGFAGVTPARAAVRSAADVRALEESLAELTNREAAARAVLAEPELFGVAADEEVPLTAAAEALATANREADVRNAEARHARRREREFTELSGRLGRSWAKLAPAEAGFAELVALTDAVNGRGQNARAMSLRSYVLAARLEQVAIAANRRLDRMSQGRYSFAHSAAAGARGTRGGLGLDVLDDYSGRRRPTKTLSGGESFLASLALALGLADVVAEETGGALLDTLFVDEGFGTLDAETLDLVMDTLDELRAGGRVVGLVSHVEELRQRIPVRLRVRKSRTGSRLELTAS
jgi:exonuclease SbcC